MINVFTKIMIFSATQYENFYSTKNDRFICPEENNSDDCAHRTCQCDSQLIEDIFANLEGLVLNIEKQLLILLLDRNILRVGILWL